MLVNLHLCNDIALELIINVYTRLGNEGSAFIEVLVGKSAWTHNEDFKVVKYSILSNVLYLCKI